MLLLHTSVRWGNKYIFLSYLYIYYMWVFVWPEQNITTGKKLSPSTVDCLHYSYIYIYIYIYTYTHTHTHRLGVSKLLKQSSSLLLYTHGLNNNNTGGLSFCYEQVYFFLSSAIGNTRRETQFIRAYDNHTIHTHTH